MILAQKATCPETYSKPSTSITSRLEASAASNIEYSEPASVVWCLQNQNVLHFVGVILRILILAPKMLRSSPSASFYVTWVSICILLAHSPLVTADEDQLGAGPWMCCKSELYGTPVVEDCKEAMQWIPFFDLPRGCAPNKATAFRQLVEPQFMRPPFSQINPLAMLQLPEIWKRSMYYEHQRASCLWPLVYAHLDCMATDISMIVKILAIQP